jgi:8-oxo-dGTP pyrophosphatase MutT (NUDIX family)
MGKHAMSNLSTRRRQVFRGKILDVGVETVELPNGETAELEIIRHPGGAAAVAVDEARRVCLLRQFRHAAGGWLWELPAGKIDPGEEPFGTAGRELAEEAGVEAGDWSDLGRLNSSPGVFTEVIYLYLARGLRPVEREHEAHEVIEVHWVPFDRALDWCFDGTITDAKTLIGLFRATRVVGDHLQSNGGGTAH